MAARGEIRWPLLGSFLAAYGEDLMAADTAAPAQRRVRSGTSCHPLRDARQRHRLTAGRGGRRRTTYRTALSSPHGGHRVPEPVADGAGLAFQVVEEFVRPLGLI